MMVSHGDVAGCTPETGFGENEEKEMIHNLLKVMMCDRD